MRAAGETRAGGQKEKEDTRWTQGLDRQDSAAAAIECPEEDDQKNTLAGRRRNKKAEDEAWERQGETAGAGRLRKVLQRLQEWVTQMGECGKNLKESGEGTWLMVKGQRQAEKADLEVARRKREECGDAGAGHERTNQNRK